MFIRRDSIPLGYVLSSPFVLIVYYFSIHPILPMPVPAWVHAFPISTCAPLVPKRSQGGPFVLGRSQGSRCGPLVPEPSRCVPMVLSSFPSLLGVFPW